MAETAPQMVLVRAADWVECWAGWWGVTMDWHSDRRTTALKVPLWAVTLAENWVGYSAGWWAGL